MRPVCVLLILAPSRASWRRALSLWLCSLLFCLGDHWCLMLLLHVVLVLVCPSCCCHCPVIPTIRVLVSSCLCFPFRVPFLPSPCAPHPSHARFCRWQMATPIACVGLSVGACVWISPTIRGCRLPSVGEVFLLCLLVLSIPPRHRPTTCPPSTLSYNAPAWCQ